MKNSKWYALILLALILINFSSCDDNENKPAGEFEKGIFVINEGNFTEADGTISFINRTDGAVTHDLFGSANSGLALGDVVQSMTLHEDLAYIVVNNSNKMEVVNANTFKSEYTLRDLSLPRYFTILDNKGYVTEWVSFTDPGRVTIIDLDNHTKVESITTEAGAEDIIAHQGKLYVSNNFTNTVSVIDPVAKTVIKTIEVGYAPGAFLVDKDNMLWVICSGAFMENNGTLVQLDPTKSNDETSNSVIKTIELNTNVEKKAAINKSKDKIYYFKGSSVFVVSISETTAPASPILTESGADFYGIGIDPVDETLYLSDTKAYASNGRVYRYTISGAVVDNVASGRGPNGFVFKE